MQAARAQQLSEMSHSYSTIASNALVDPHHFSPGLPPAISHDPVLLRAIHAPAHHRNLVVHPECMAALRDDTPLVVVQRRGGVDPTADRTAVVDFGHHPGLATCLPRGVDCGVGVVRQADALLAEGAAGAAGIRGGAGPVRSTSVAETFRRLLGAGHVRLAGVERDSVLREPAVRGAGAAAVARAAATAVQEMLHSQVDVNALPFAGDLDAVGQGG
eukprot:SAG11_NODE_845_length_6885_cov_6.782346_2_plen_216_part_00